MDASVSGASLENATRNKVSRRLAGQKKLFLKLPVAAQRQLLVQAGVFTFEPAAGAADGEMTDDAVEEEIAPGAEQGPELTDEDEDDAPLTKLLKRTPLLPNHLRAVIPKQVESCLLSLEMQMPVFSVDFGSRKEKPAKLHAWGKPPGPLTSSGVSPECDSRGVCRMGLGAGVPTLPLAGVWDA